MTVHGTTLKKAVTVAERVSLVVGSGDPNETTPKTVGEKLSAAGVPASRSQISKALNALRRERQSQQTDTEASEPSATAPETVAPTEEAPQPQQEAPEAAEGSEAADSERPRSRKRWLSIFAAGVVAVVAAITSFSHMQEVALSAGQSELISYLLPLSVDGLIVVGSVALVDGATKRGIAWLSFTIGTVTSVAANVISAEPNLLSRSVAAWPALALLLTVEVLLQQRQR